MTTDDLANSSSFTRNDSVLSVWTFTARETCRTFVIPDGCEDLIIEYREGSEMRYFISQLSRTTYSVELEGGTSFLGLRLKPGTHIKKHALFKWSSSNTLQNLLESNRLDEFCERPTAIIEALDCLKSGISTVSEAVQLLGVSSRTLQRTLREHTGRSPHFWLALARARRAGRSLHQHDKLSDAALELGYSDQAHMTREVKSWFGVTPSEIVPDTILFSQLHESGYG